MASCEATSIGRGFASAVEKSGLSSKIVISLPVVVRVWKCWKARLPGVDVLLDL